MYKAAKTPTVDLTDFFPAVLNSYRFDDQTQLTGAPNGRLVGLPKGVTREGTMRLDPNTLERWKDKMDTVWF